MADSWASANNLKYKMSLEPLMILESMELINKTKHNGDMSQRHGYQLEDTPTVQILHNLSTKIIMWLVVT